MPEVHEGGCLCGAVRYKARSAPMRTTACHCTFCQRRTGSAFGFIAYFKQEDVEITRGEPKTYQHRSDESGRWLRMEFCPTCGTTLAITVELLPGARGLAGGTFDDPTWLKIERHTWTRSAHPWFSVPADVEQFPKSSLQKPLQIK